MRRRRPFTPSDASPRLWVRRSPGRSELWTETVGAPPAVYGERWERFDERTLRSFEPARSKLACAAARGWEGPLPRPGERWLYLGAASGTTASHVADLLGPGGTLYALERSPRPFSRLLGLAERWPNLLPILGDALEPERYADRVPIVDGIYADVAQADQAGIVLRNAALFLRDGTGALLIALKTSSMGRGVAAATHLRAAEEALDATVPLVGAVRLEPFYRSHYLLGGRRGSGRPGERRGREPHEGDVVRRDPRRRRGPPPGRRSR